jgi:hypothetical protein
LNPKTGSKNFQKMVDLLSQVPDIVWAALLASFLTLGGVLITNRNSRIQKLAELQHDANQRDREREMALRRDVYLAAAEAISKGQNILTRLIELNVSDQELGAEFIRDSAAIAKIQVVGTNSTVQAVSAFSQELGAAYLELLLKRVPLIERKNEIELLTKFINRSQTELDRYINLMKQLNLEGNVDRRVWEVIENNVEYEQEQQAQHTEKQQKLWAKQNPEHLQFAELCFGRFMAVSKLIPPTVFAAREELELPIDREAYLEAFNKNLEKGNEIFKSFLRDAGKLMDA